MLGLPPRCCEHLAGISGGEIFYLGSTSGKPQLYYCAPMIVNKPKLRTMVHKWHIIVQDRHNEPNGPFYTMVEKPIENGAPFLNILNNWTLLSVNGSQISQRQQIAKQLFINF